MSSTKETILLTALRLFAIKGYDAVSVSEIAGALGMTKSALYKHYKNKRALFDSIFDYVCQLDVARAQQAGVPEKEYSEAPETFVGITQESLIHYMTAQFRYWTEDEIACNFRKMLTLEQYKSQEMNNLYQKVLVRGPLEYIESILSDMLKNHPNATYSAKELAIAFHAPFYLLLSLMDATSQQSERLRLTESYINHLNTFFDQYFPNTKHHERTPS